MKQFQNERFIKIVAAQLTENFLTPLWNICGEKNYYSHVGCLAEILDWAEDFCELYTDKYFQDQLDHKDFQDDSFLEALIICYGQKRLLAFYKQNRSSQSHFIVRHSSQLN